MVKVSTVCVDVVCSRSFLLFFYKACTYIHALYVPVHTASDRFELVLGHLCANTLQ